MVDWSRLYERVEVLARVQRAGAPALLVRATPRGGNAHTWLVDEESGLALELLALDEVPGMGVVGSVTRFDDWREVAGVRLPFQSSFRFASSILGAGTARWLEVESGVELSDGGFETPAMVGEKR